mgnify:CR=1 FL=1
MAVEKIFDEIKNFHRWIVISCEKISGQNESFQYEGGLSYHRYNA